MAASIKCPLCGQTLVPVGKKGAKMRCDYCRSVFDVFQLRQYYGIDTPDETGFAAHEYETEHMHAKEMEKQYQQQVKKVIPVPQTQSPIISNEQPSPVSNFVPPTPVPSQQFAHPSSQIPRYRPLNQPNASMGGKGIKTVIWVVVLLFLLPSILSVLFGFVAVFSTSSSNSNSNTSYVINSNTNFNSNVNRR